MPGCPGIFYLCYRVYTSIKALDMNSQWFTGCLYNFFQKGLGIMNAMEKLFVNKTIEINAPASKVWNALTRREYTDQWALEFTGGTEFHIESDWKLGSPVLWTGQDGITYELTEQDGKTLLKISQGDFSTMVEGEKYRDMSAEIWDRVLLKVKGLAEG